MNTQRTDYTKLVEALGALSEQLETISEKLRVYDIALGFFELNYPDQASIFNFCIDQVAPLPELQHAVSPEIQTSIANLYELAARVFQASSNPPKS
jgi:hypothetical protein